MRKILFLIVLICTILSSNAQIISEYISATDLPTLVPGYSQVTTINTKTLIYSAPTLPTEPIPIDEDSTTETNGPYYFGDALTANIQMSDGNYTNTSLGKVWSLKLIVTGAKNIGINFDQFNLSSSAEMYIFNESKTELKGAIKAEHFNSTSNGIGIAPLRDSSITIFIIEINNFSTFQSSIAASQILAGFRNFDDNSDEQVFSRASVNCHPSVKCYVNYESISRSVARFISNGLQCTGTLLNNELRNGRAFFLTAFHCLDRNKNGIIDANEESALTSASFQFQFWRANCSGSSNNPGLSFSGAVLRAAWTNSDMVLLELTNPPGIGDGINYAGWNNNSSAPGNSSSSTILHHPQGADMRISFTNTVKNKIFDIDYWQASYQQGTVDRGSSGSALFNPSGQVIGQLKGGWSSCDFTDFSDRYGKFSTSWSGGGTNATRLSNWLSPTQSLGSMTTLNIAPLVIQGNDFVTCSGNTYFFAPPNLLGCTYNWTVTPNLQIVAGQNTATVQIIGIPNNSGNSAGTITLTITDTKGRNRTAIAHKTVSYSASNILGYYEDGISVDQNSLQDNNTVGNGFTYVTITSPDILSYTWSLAGGTPISWQAGDPLSFSLANNTTASFHLQGQTTCGTINKYYVFNAQGGPPLGYKLSPNPTLGLLTITVDDTKSKVDKSANYISEVIVVDKLGNALMRKQFAKNSQSVQLNIGGLKTDLYSIKVFNGKEWQSIKVIKQ